MIRFIESIFGTKSERDVKAMQPLLEAVGEHERRCVRMTNQQLRAQTPKFKEQLAQGAALDDLLPEAFATVREAAKRTIGMRHFDVQIIGGVVLHRGNIAEMITGEGKTLVATLPCYLNGLTGQGVHVVTVNDYLARRDCEWMQYIYEFLGLTVGLIQHDMHPFERKAAYRADITYGTNNEYGFDYLRDNMAQHPDLVVQRDLNYAIIDEIDSILIDEARTPLIISGRPEKSTDLYNKVDEVVRRLRRDEHFEMDEKNQFILLNEEGMAAVERGLEIDNLYASNEHLGIVHMVEQALKAHNFFKKDDEYVVRDGQVMIVDEFTGRIMEGRRFSEGLHQAIEAKERVTIQNETQTVASISYQNYFTLYNKISGMTGTAMTEASEFSQIYGLEVREIPTNLPMQRKDERDLVFATERGKFRYVVDRIADFHENGRPVLVGTTSIEKSELVAEMLREKGIGHFEVLNAKQHEREASIVANAGNRQAITIATNMAGRGTDIKLGEGVREAGGLAIVGTERHESRRIDNQLRGRSGRQGDPGSTQFYLSLEDEVARLFGGDKVKRMVSMFGGADELDETPLDQKMVSNAIERAQKSVEDINFERRKNLKEFDDVMNRQRQIIYEMRREVLRDDDVRERIEGMIESVVFGLCEEYAPSGKLPDEWDLEGLEARLRYYFGTDIEVTAPESGESEGMATDITNRVIAEYERRQEAFVDIIHRSYAERFGAERVRHLNFTRMAKRQFSSWEKMALLQTVDDRWIEQLYTMDYLRSSVNLRAIGQREPLVEYKREGYETFQQMMNTIDEEVVQTIFRLTNPEGWQSRNVNVLEQSAVFKEQQEALQRIQRYQTVDQGSQGDRSFAAYDTTRYDLAGRNRAAQEAAAAQGGAQPAGQQAESDGAPASPRGNRKQRRAAEARRRKEAKKSKKAK